MLTILTSWATRGSQDVANIFLPLCLCSWGSLPLAGGSSAPIPNFTLWIWSPEAILIIGAHHHPSQKLDVIPKLYKSPDKKRRETGRKKGKNGGKFPLAFPKSQVTNNYYARQNFLFIHLLYFPYKNKGSSKASTMSDSFLYSSQNTSMGQSDIQ